MRDEDDVSVYTNGDAYCHFPESLVEGRISSDGAEAKKRLVFGCLVCFQYEKLGLDSNFIRVRSSSSFPNPSLSYGSADVSNY